jgi:hypothetical protein
MLVEEMEPAVIKISAVFLVGAVLLLTVVKVLEVEYIRVVNLTIMKQDVSLAVIVFGIQRTRSAIRERVFLRKMALPARGIVKMLNVSGRRL